MTATQWLVLDNVRNGWNYWTNLDRETAEQAYLWCVRNEYLRDGKLTAAGLSALSVNSDGSAEKYYCT